MNNQSKITLKGSKNITTQEFLEKTKNYTIENALKELDELKNYAFSCVDKNGNPNLSIALKVIECKAKIAGLFTQNKQESKTIVKMGEITIDGEQLKLKIGED